MTIIQAIILGLIQGLTEFIPVSSSGHLVLAHYFLHINQTGLFFVVALHVGTLLALLIYFYRDILKLVPALFSKRDESRLAWWLVAATVPAVIAGLLLETAAESVFKTPRIVALNLALVSFVMLLAERYYHQRSRRPTKLDKVTGKQALVMGLSQAAAVIPGVSRSGSTITAGLFTGMDRVSATRFSLLLGIPITAGAITKICVDHQVLQQIQDQRTIFVIGAFTALFSGLLAIRFLLRYLAHHSLAAFAYYRLAVFAAVWLVIALR